MQITFDMQCFERHERVFQDFSRGDNLLVSNANTSWIKQIYAPDLPGFITCFFFLNQTSIFPNVI